MGTDLFKQGIDGGDGLPASTVAVVQDPTGSLSLSKTVTPEATGPKVSAIPEPDPELLALFAPQADGDFDADGLGDRERKADKPSRSADDWRALLDDSIPVRSLAKEAHVPSPAMTAEFQAVKLVGDPAKKKRKKKSGSKKGKKKRFGLPTALAQPTADRSQSATFARSADAFSDGMAGSSSPALTAETKAISKPKTAPAPKSGPASKTGSAVKVTPAPVATPAPTANPKIEPDPNVALALQQTLAKTKPSTSTAAGPTTVKPAIALADDLVDKKSAGAGAILADRPDPEIEDRPVDTEVDAYRAVLNGVDAFRSRSRIVLMVAAVSCLAVIGALLVAGESNDGGADTTADTEEVAAQNERADDEAEPAASSTTDSTNDRRNDDRTTLTTDDDVSFAALAQPASSTTERSVEDPSSTGSSTAEGTGGTGDTDATDGESTTTDPSSSTSDASSTSEAPSTTATGSTVCTGVTWNLVLDEGFDGSSLDTAVWAVGDGGAAGQGIQQPNAVSVESGYLNITAQMIDGTLVSGGVQHRSSQMYGRYEARVRADTDGVMNGRIQTAGSGASHVIYDAGSVGSASTWTTMAVEWTPSSVKYYMDDTLVRTVEDNVSAVDQTLSIRYDASAPTIASNVTMQIDSVKVWAYGGGC